MRVLSLVFLLTAHLTACASAGAAEIAAVRMNSASKPVIRLGAGDIIEIHVFREQELNGVYRVNSVGDLEFPLIGRVSLAGKTPEDVGNEIRQRLSQGFLKDPQVTVFVREHHSQKVHVLGQVVRAGTFTYEPGMTVIQAITNAGGFAKLAATNSVRVTRVLDDKEQTFLVPVGDIGGGRAPNFDLKPGDIIFVPESIF